MRHGPPFGEGVVARAGHALHVLNEAQLDLESRSSWDPIASDTEDSMRRASSSAIRPTWFGLATLALILLGLSTSSMAQIPTPRVPDIKERSGLLQRFEVYDFKNNLPKDPYRDNWYLTRVGDHAKVFDTNTFWNGGLYGVRLPARETQSVYPYFYGAPGQSTITAESKSWRPSYLRAVQQLFHQRKPVGMYYDRGSYVPIYDLDSFSPGPGPDYWPWFFQGSRGG